ncbi:MAG: DEAD/DEAH box helicase, partial [Planctomycetes bacterium]|nr:DEAD/DEAH box helicase [Planctomycetota bacterium]
MEATAASTTASRLMRDLPERISSHEGFIPLLAAVESGQWATLDGVWGSSCALVAAEIVRRVSRTLVIVTSHQDDIDDFCDDLALFSPIEPEKFPSWETEPGERITHDEIFGDRLRALKRLLHAEAPADVPLVVTSIQSLLQPTPSRENLAAGTRRLAVGQRVDVEPLLSWLVECGFHHTSAVELPSEFSHRGGILDIFAPDWYQPVRIELFDDEVESIRRFDVGTQRSLESLEDIEVTTVKPRAGDRGHLTDYLPETSVIVLIEPDRIDEEGRQFLTKLQRPEACHSVPDVMRRIGQHPVLSVAAVARGGVGEFCHLAIESVERFSGEIDRVRSELDRIGEDHTVFVISQTDAEVERLSEILRTTHVARAGRLMFPIGGLRQGFRLARDRVLVITAGELFHRGELRRLPRRRLGKAIDSFMDLRSGDLVVHLTHGIGRYRGLELLDKEGRVEEHLKIEFHGGTKLYVPASKIGLVQKYVGGTKTRPTLAKIGSKTWVRQKKAAEAAVVDLAAEMLQMQAERQARPGIAFSVESDWQHEFDASFPYRETPDQRTALSAISQDMRSPQPMDRLLCGDVGFGKTELAMRAAFRAVDNGFQVAVLAPTTVLVEQHYRTFRERMAEFPLDIARLSRFGTGKEQRDIVGRLAGGQIDIVIGTHRLASQDVTFHNLGLVIIDEEQRFGVEVKERLKSLRSSVDVLTLSATPIPRTLHMSLVGVRDISNL